MATIHDLLSAQVNHVETVEISGLDVAIRGVTLVEILRVIARFPELKKVFFGAEQETLIDLLVTTGPEAIAAVLACATNAPGDKTVEAGIAGLPDDQLFALLSKAITLTMPEGLEGFFLKLTKLAAKMGLFQPESQDVSAEAA